MAHEPIQWMEIEEIEASLKESDWVDLTDAINGVRQSMIAESESPEAERRRHQEAIAASRFLDDPVIYSQR